MFSLCVIFSSCSSDSNEILNDENGEVMENNLFKSNNKLNDLLNDQIFLEVVDAQITISKLSYDRTDLEVLVAENSEDVGSYASAIGFESQEDFTTFFNDYNSDLLYLEDKYKMSEISIGELQGLVLQTPQFSTVSNDNCDRARRNCVGYATTVYGLEALGCSALNLTVVGGLVCYGLITSQYLISIDDCTLTWEQCKDK